jgi:two-component system response regulator HydG
LVRARTFRKDLFFRLDVLSIRIPPLRERREDIPHLVDHFLLRAQERTPDSSRRRLTSDALHAIEAHAWPGNVRELENVIQRLVVSTTRAEIDGIAVRATLTPLTPGDPTDALAAAHLSLNDVEERYVEAVLRQAGGNKSSAAAILGIDVSTLYRRARQRRR